MKFYSAHTVFNADIYTPVDLYLAFRNSYRKTCLLESNDYNSRRNGRSFIGFEPLIEITLNENNLSVKSKDENKLYVLNDTDKVANQVQKILEQFQFITDDNLKNLGIENGFYGRLSFEFNQIDNSHLTVNKSDLDIPSLHFFIYQYIVVIDHFHNTGYLIENSMDNQFSNCSIQNLLKGMNRLALPFELIGEEKAQFSDSEFSDLVEKARDEIKIGNVFQLVVSNAFQQAFFGDDFQVYRQLRRLNPSPYLFYFDFESYRLFGSSPEAQVIIKNGVSEIHPIAGTIPITNDDQKDKVSLQHLIQDEKENAEHTMLVDLARNDLSRDCTNVRVASYKEIQHFSHVMHLVSRISGKLSHDKSFVALCNSFPAGTLSGTPKSKAIELINQFEQKTRDYYGGCVGLFTANADINSAIVIRSFLSKNNVLHYRAGAGVVYDSNPETEAQEVHHKLRALRVALKKTQLENALIPQI